jgi:hypothetical protein
MPMLFPEGFTGFHQKGTVIHPTFDPIVFKTVCFAAARQLGGRVIVMEYAKETPNFHCATLAWGHDSNQVTLLCNRLFWIVGFCKPRAPGCCANEYVDAPKFAEVIGRMCDWRILSKQDLEAVIDDTMLSAMSVFDREVIETANRKGYFTPSRTIGDVLFHYWD